MTARKQIYLHIGRAKVGSTALQHFLFDNREHLAAHGILYPEAPMLRRASHKLALVFKREYRDALECEGVTAAEMYSSTFREAEQRELSRIVASSEYLFVVPPEEVAACIPGDWEARVICYVRRQDEVLLSSYAEELKVGLLRSGERFEEYAASPLRLSWLDYEPVLDAWAAQFGRENIIVRVYEKGQLRGNIFEDFAELLGAATADMALPEGRVNRSLPRDFLEFIRIINSVPALASSPVLKNHLRNPLVHLAEHVGTPSDQSPRGVASGRLRREILERFSDSNAAVARKYLGRQDGVLFRDTEVEDSGDDSAQTSLDLERFAHMMAASLGAQQRRIQRLQRELNELKRRFSE